MVTEPSRIHRRTANRPAMRWRGARPSRPAAELPASVVPGRRADLDWLRLLGLLGVFCVHVAEPFNPWDTWHIQNGDRTKWAGEVVLSIAPWVMPLFMVVAGAAASYALRDRANRNFVAERTRRLFVPFVLAMLILVPPQVYLERLSRGQFQGSFVAFYPHFFEGVYPRGNFSWHHLWFLAYLFVFALVTLPLFRALQRDKGRRLLAAVATRCQAPGAILLLGVPWMAWRILLWAGLPESNTIVGGFSNHVLLLPAYVTGFVLVQEPRLHAALVRQWWFAIAPALSMTAAMFTLAWHEEFLNRLPPAYSPGYVVLWMLYTFGTWCWLIVLLGAASALRDRRPSVLDHALRIVYPFYLLHHVVIVAVAYVVVRWNAALSLKAVSLTVLSLAVTLVLCELAVLRPRLRHVGAARRAA